MTTNTAESERAGQGSSLEVDGALNPAPSSGGTQSQRAFEEWMASSNYPELAHIALAKLDDGIYRSQLTFAAWQGWQAGARSALAVNDQLLQGCKDMTAALMGIQDTLARYIHPDGLEADEALNAILDIADHRETLAKLRAALAAIKSATTPVTP